MRTYAKVILGVLVLGGFLGGIGWGLRALYDAGGDARENRIVREWQAKELKLVRERDEWKARAESKVIDERPIWNARKEKAREVVVDCELPAELISVLRESGIFTGR